MQENLPAAALILTGSALLGGFAFWMGANSSDNLAVAIEATSSFASDHHAETCAELLIAGSADDPGGYIEKYAKSCSPLIDDDVSRLSTLVETQKFVAKQVNIVVVPAGLALIGLVASAGMIISHRKSLAHSNS